MTPQHKPLVFSGMQPTGDPHLGNYLGAIRNWLRFQEQYECLYCVVDLHAITQPQDPKDMARATREVAAAYMASGINPKRAIIFNQSQVSGHAELAWIFNCIARMGWLNRMTQWKDKAGKNSERESVGLFAYPNLMAADILLYKGTLVPVGDDQKQHVELTRDIAAKFNNDFGVPDFFPLPDPIIQGPATRVMSLRDGSKKMSKSDDSDLSRINLTDNADTIAQKIRKAKTDSGNLPETAEGLKGRPEADNLLGIFAALSDTPKEAVITQFSGKQFSDLKNALADLTVEKLGPITSEMARLIKDPGEIDRFLAQGAERARSIAAPILKDVKHILGFIGP